MGSGHTDTQIHSPFYDSSLLHYKPLMHLEAIKYCHTEIETVKKRQSANSLLRFSNLQNLLLNLPFCWNLQATLNLNFSTHLLEEAIPLMTVHDMHGDVIRKT